MDAITVKDIMDCIERLAPQDLAQDYDNIGLLIGDSKRRVNKIIVGLEVTNSLIDEAINKACDMIVVHHPLIFSPLNRIVEQDPIAHKVIRLIKADINVYVAHTNLDMAQHGLNDYLCEVLDIKPNIEIGFEQNRLLRICDVKQQAFKQLVWHVKERLNLDTIRYVGHLDKQIKRIGLCSGSGMSFFDMAIEQGADAYITGDLKYHDAVKAMELEVPVIDAGHYGTEIICRQLFENILKENFQEDIQIFQHNAFLDPICTL